MYTDISIVIALLLFLMHGYKKGFVKMVYSIVSLIISIILLALLKDTFAEFVSSSDIGLLIGKFFAGGVDNPVLAGKCASAVCYFVSCVVLYIAIRFALKFALKLLDSVFSLPLLKLVNKLLGSAAGFIAGAIWVVIVLNILNILPQTSDYVSASFIADYFKIIFI